MNSVKLLLIAGAVGALAGCFGSTTAPTEKPSKTLSQLLQSKKYTAFTLPRDKWGVGTIIKFTDGEEDIIAFDDECLAISAGETASAQTSEVSLETASYKRGSIGKLEAALAKDVVEDVELTGAFNDTRVSEVTISTDNPIERAVSQVALERRVNLLVEQENEACVAALFTEGHFVIDRVLRVDGVEITFDQDNDAKLTLDIDLAKAIGVDGEISTEIVGKSELSSKAPRLIGYQLYRFDSESGFGRTEITSERLSETYVASLKAASAE